VGAPCFSAGGSDASASRKKSHFHQSGFKAVSQLLWPDKDREVWFSLGENHVKASSSGLHQLRNCFSPGFPGRKPTAKAGGE
jgi:hypothetical protein